MRRYLPALAALLTCAGALPARGLLVPEDKSLPPLAMLRHQVAITIDDQVAVTQVEQTFRNHTDRRLEATYLFPVPKGASVNGFAMTVNGSDVAYIETAVHTRREQTDLETGVTVADRRQNPEPEAMLRQSAELMKSALAQLSERDRDILIRFYLKEQSQQQICEEMRLTETQFRLLKSRAKAKFGEIGKKKLASSGFLSVFVRSHSG